MEARVRLAGLVALGEKGIPTVSAPATNMGGPMTRMMVRTAVGVDAAATGAVAVMGEEELAVPRLVS